jgi:hypothetical protein
MRYLVRLIDKKLPNLTREIALGCWNAADSLLAERPPGRLYRELYRAVRRVMCERFEAFRYCGYATTCDIGQAVMGTRGDEPAGAEPERAHLYIGGESARPTALVAELMRAAVRVIVGAYPERRWKGLAGAVKRQIERALRGRVYRSEACGETRLCEANERVDPWTLDEPIDAT